MCHCKEITGHRDSGIYFEMRFAFSEISLLPSNLRTSHDKRGLFSIFASLTVIVHESIVSFCSIDIIPQRFALGSQELPPIDKLINLILCVLSNFRLNYIQTIQNYRLYLGHLLCRKRCNLSGPLIRSHLWIFESNG